ncbi:pleckstrin homology domain-containing family G member 3 [Spea bombifrons]|uniref:pleckstrin homology domain-containing family G member 3 n=1 Tax=Spea bombifrons TaxID=233779 RepID=UPI00234A70EC|nr:pleckstrin homology domain-containing family G member 3 [Spea bombifrons]
MFSATSQQTPGLEEYNQEDEDVNPEYSNEEEDATSGVYVFQTAEDKDHGLCPEHPEQKNDKESPRLSAASSSSNEKLSSSTSLCTEFYDSDRPVSVISTASSGSCREIYENISGGFKGEEQVENEKTRQDMELVSSAAGSLQATYREMQSGMKSARTPNSNTANRHSRLGSRSLSPFGTKVNVITHKLSYVERVVLEIIETERMYVQDLRSIVEDYLGGIIDRQELPMKPEQVSALFGNIEDIYQLNSELLQDLDSCRDDPVAVASCFVEKSQEFDIYTQYCTNYPNSVATLTECMRNKVLAKFFREKQEMLNQSLPLGSYLLKPVQRILKYHLLLQEIAKHYDVKAEGYEIVEEAIETMTGVAWYINDMKRKHEHAVRLQEIQSLLLNWKGLDLTTYGELVLEGTFRVQRVRNERTFFLFDKALFITKKRGDHFVYKTHIPCSSLMLIESTRDSLCFSITHYKNSKQQHNLQAKTVEEKRLWTHHIKKLILENHDAIIPQKAKEAILEMDAIYPGRYRYSPERLKKAMSTVDPPVTHRSGRRQSEPAKHILKQLGEKVGLKHAGSDGALLDFGDILQPNTSIEQPQAEGHEEQPASTQLSRNSGADLSASEEEEEVEIHLREDDQSKESVSQESHKGFKRQNSQSSGNAEKRRSVEVTAASQEVVYEMEKENSEPEATYSTVVVSSSDIVLAAPLEHIEDNQPEEEERGIHQDAHNPSESVETETTEDLKTFSSEEEDEEATSHESTSILPPSVLDQASVIAERFINNISRRSSLALDDGKVIGYLTPRLTSRSSSVLSLECTDKMLYQNGSSDFENSVPAQESLSNSDTAITEITLNNGNPSGIENVFEERERVSCKRRESILSIQDRQLLNKIKSYYDNAENQDASFSIKRRESLTYIPAGLVRNSVFKINSLPRCDTSQVSLPRARLNSSGNISNGGSRLNSWGDVSSSVTEDSEQHSFQAKQSVVASKNGVAEDQFPVSDEEFKSPEEMMKIWEEIENVGAWKDVNVVITDVTTKNSVDNPARVLENKVESPEPLVILEDGDLSTITEESPVTTPESTSPNQLRTADIVFNEKDFRTPIKLHPQIMQIANCMDADMSEKMKNKVFQLARQYSQRIKCNKPVPHRRLKEIEDELRRGSLPSVKEEKIEQKGKLKPMMSLPTYDHIVLQELSPSSPTSASFREKSPKRLSFSTSDDSQETASPGKSDGRSPLSPVKTEKFHWPDVRELRSRYTHTAGTGKALSVNRSHSVPDKMIENTEDSSLNQNKEHMTHSYSMNINYSDGKNRETSYSNRPLSNVENTMPVSPGLLEKTKTLQNSRNSGQGMDVGYYISAEATLENNKKVIVMEKLPMVKGFIDCSAHDLESDETYVHIRSPTTREKISLKAVIERCKAYQESEEYRIREENARTEVSTEPNQDPSPGESKQEKQLLQTNEQNRVKSLREKFQTLTSSSCKHSELHENS